MSLTSWQTHIQTILNRTNSRLAIVGIGHEIRGDDAVGVLIVRELLYRLKQKDHLLVVDAGVAPENITGQLRRFSPTLILLIDAVEMGQEAGTVDLIDLKRKIVERYPSTHSLSLSLFASYLQVKQACEVQILGIQILHTMIDEPLSSPVQSAKSHIVDAIVFALEQS